MITKINNYEFIEDGDLIYSIVDAQHGSSHQAYALVHGLSNQGIKRIQHVQNDPIDEIDYMDTQLFIPGNIVNELAQTDEYIPVKGIEPYAFSAHNGIDLHGMYVSANKMEYIGESAFENANIEYVALSFDHPVKIAERAFFGNEHMTIHTTAETINQYNPVNDRSFKHLDDLNKLSLDEIFDKQIAFRLSFTKALEEIAIDKDVKAQLEIEKKFKNSYDINEAEDAANYILDDKVPDFEELDLND